MPNHLTGATDLHERAHHVLRTVCRRLGLDPTGAELLRLRSNAVFKLRAPIVVRIATAPNAIDRLRTVLAVTRWLANRGFPTVTPADDVAAQPVTLDGVAVTFWHYVPSGTTKVTTGDLARLLRDLHASPMPPFPIRTLADPLSSVRASVLDHRGVLDLEAHSWLTERISSLTKAWEALPFVFSPTLVHGDAWIDNLLRHEDGHIILGDWDSVAIGPREWDLIHSYHGQRRFGLIPHDVNAFASTYGYDLREWIGFETLMQIRDFYAIGIHIRNAPGDPFSRRELTRRLESLKNGNTLDRWYMKDG
jgi:aminoglycoside phosphotransferase (APT) family kinase protein